MPKIINGICEFCGVPANNCQHFKDKPKPMDVKEILAMSDHPYDPNITFPKVAIPPLTEQEKAKSVAEAQAKAEAFRASQAVLTELNEPENTQM